MDSSQLQQLLSRACAPWDAKWQKRNGFYALFLKPECNIPGLKVGEHGLLYIGDAENGRSPNDHFMPSCDTESRSLLRNALGALMRAELDLLPAPVRRKRLFVRMPGGFVFDPESEARLTSWMQHSIEVAFITHDNDPSAARWMLIGKLQPPLNFKGWNNPQERFVRRLTRKCQKTAAAFTVPRLKVA